MTLNADFFRHYPSLTSWKGEITALSAPRRGPFGEACYCENAQGDRMMIQTRYFA